jgi:predicted Fe-Mo cluster-binding NifX family protein
MKVAIPIFRSRVSPVLDWCTRLLLVRIRTGREETREEIEVGGLDLLERVERLSNAGTDVLICGAIGDFVARLLESKGIRVIPWISGEIEDVIHALASEEFPHDRFLMPGCRQRKRRCMASQERKRRGQGRVVHRVSGQRGQGKGRGQGFGRGRSQGER